MIASYAQSAAGTFNPDPQEPIMTSIFKQYERVIIESLITSFGLDFLIKDKYGGDVDTIHNVRQVGKDEQMTYKNSANQQAYENRGAYNSHEYHSDSRYTARNRGLKQQKESGNLYDAYTGEKIPRNAKVDLDHVISAKEAHKDPGRVLAGLTGKDLANSPENLQPTNPHTNRSKGAKSMSEHLSKHDSEYSEAQKANMRAKDKSARKAYEQKLANAYYTSPQFAKDTAFAAGKVGAQMGIRQALGFVFAEIWFSVKEKFAQMQERTGFNLGDNLKALGEGIKQGWQNAQAKYKEIFSRFLSGSLAGVLSSLTTTLCNIFFKTAKNVVKIIRNSWVSLVEAAKVLFFNPDGYSFGDRMKAVVKILATGASVVAGVLVSEAIGKTPLGLTPVIGNIVQAFCGALVTGIMSCTLLYVLDRNELINKLFKLLDNLNPLEKAVNYYRQQADYFERYAAQLMEIDLEKFRQETAVYNDLASSLEKAQSETELNAILINATKALNIKLPWEQHESFDNFMRDSSAKLVFE